VAAWLQRKTYFPLTVSPPAQAVVPRLAEVGRNQFTGSHGGAEYRPAVITYLTVGRQTLTGDTVGVTTPTRCPQVKGSRPRVAVLRHPW
jgi:hypothetical protein